MADTTRDELGAPNVVDRATFQAALDALRVREKAHTREGDAIAAARRRLPMVEVDGATPLIGERGAVTLLNTFEDRDPQSVRRFPTFTRDLHALADWHQQCGVRPSLDPQAANGSPLDKSLRNLKRVLRPSFVYFDTDLWRSVLRPLQAAEIQRRLNIALRNRSKGIEDAVAPVNSVPL
jgi:hypothetical protein